MKKYTLPILIFVAIFVALVSVFSIYGKSQNIGFGENERYSLLAASSTLSAAFTGAGAVSSTVSTDGMRHKAIAFRYLPKSHAATLEILVEEALDNNCENYNPAMFTLDQASTTVSYPIYASSTGQGIPYQFPHAKFVTASGTTYGGKFDLSDSISQCIRVSAREAATSTAGILTLELLTAN